MEAELPFQWLPPKATSDLKTACPACLGAPPDAGKRGLLMLDRKDKPILMIQCGTLCDTLCTYIHTVCMVCIYGHR